MTDAGPQPEAAERPRSADPSPPEAAGPDLEVTYGAIVWEQFKANRIAWAGLWAIVAMVLLAVFAPVLCLERPFVITHLDPSSGQRAVEWPWFVALLGDRNLFENGVDVFFNLLLVLSPAIAASCLLLIRRLRGRRRAERAAGWQRLVVGWSALVLVGMIALSVWRPGQPYKDYIGLHAEGVAEVEHEIARQRLDALSQGARLDAASALKLRAQAPWALFPPIAQSFRATHPDEVLAPMSLRHPFGTDDRGRDVFARVLYGARTGLTIGVVSVSIYILLGVLLGALAGFFGGRIDMIILRVIEIMICFPVLILIMTLAAFIDDRNIFHIMLLIGLTRWTGPARLTRGEFLKLKDQDFVQAAIASGVPLRQVIFRHVLPNALSPVLVTASFGVASAILIESTLSFLGLGDASAPSWGELINIGRQTDTMRLILLPGLAIFLTVSLFNLVGEGLQDALDPKRRR